jgi:hypothetical protein
MEWSELPGTGLNHVLDAQWFSWLSAGPHGGRLRAAIARCSTTIRTAAPPDPFGR